MVQKLVIDADPGIGSALAIVAALEDPDLEVVGLTATAGRVSGLAATRNIQAVVDCLDPSRRPRLGHCNADAPALKPPAELDGSMGLGEWDVPVAGLYQRHESARLLVEIVRGCPQEITLLTLGPMTNVGLAADLDPNILDHLGELVCVGGAVRVSGDVTAAAEFNVTANVETARRVLTSSGTSSKTLVPLDVCGQVVLSPDQYRRLRERATGVIAELLDRLLPHWFRTHHERLGIEGVVLHGVTAVASVSRPQLFQRQDMLVDVETAGTLTRGMTVFDRRREAGLKANIEVCVDVDVQGVVDYLSSVLTCR